MEREHSLLLTHHIKPDYGFYIQNDDRLYVAAYSSASSLRVRFSGYFLSANGEVRQYAVDLAPTNDRAVTSALQSIGEGFILSCIAHLLSGNANRGQCYVRARIQRGTGATIVPIVQLLGGYLSDEFSPSFPYGRIEGPLEGSGYIRQVTGTNPAAGAGADETVPTGARWNLLNFAVAYTTDATVANRYFILDVSSPTEWQIGIISILAQTAGTTRYIWLAIGTDRVFEVNTAYQSLPLPIVPLTAGWRLSAYATNGVAGDDFGAPLYTVEEWIEA